MKLRIKDADDLSSNKVTEDKEKKTKKKEEKPKVVKAAFFKIEEKLKKEIQEIKAVKEVAKKEYVKAPVADKKPSLTKPAVSKTEINFTDSPEYLALLAVAFVVMLSLVVLMLGVLVIVKKRR